jgi:hypothetical protein
VVIPDHHFVGGIARVPSAPDNRQQVASEQHFHNSDSAVRKNALERLAEGIHVVYYKSVCRSTRETAAILVESSEQHFIVVLCFVCQIHRHFLLFFRYFPSQMVSRGKANS